MELSQKIYELRTGSGLSQLDLAEKLNLPVIVHDRDAHHDCLEIVRAHPNVTGVYHCYSGGVEDAKTLMERGELDLIYILDEPRYSNNWNKLMEQREEIVFVASASLREELGGKELTIEELLTQPFFLTE